MKYEGILKDCYNDQIHLDEKKNIFLFLLYI